MVNNKSILFLFENSIERHAIERHNKRVEKNGKGMQSAVKNLYHKAFGQEMPKHWTIGHGGHSGSLGTAFLYKNGQRHLAINLDQPKSKRQCIPETMVHEMVHMHYEHPEHDNTFHKLNQQHYAKIEHNHIRNHDMHKFHPNSAHDEGFDCTDYQSTWNHYNKLKEDFGTPGNDGSGTDADAIKSTKPISPVKKKRQKGTPPNVTLSATSKQDLEQTNESFDNHWKTGLEGLGILSKSPTSLCNIKDDGCVSPQSTGTKNSLSSQKKEFKQKKVGFLLHGKNKVITKDGHKDLEQRNGRWYIKEEVKAKKGKKKFDRAAYFKTPHFGEETTKPEPVVSKTVDNNRVNKKNNNPKASQGILNSMKIKKPLIEPLTAVGQTAGIAEVAPPGWKGTVEHMKKHKNITNPFALAWYMKNKGDKSHIKEDNLEDTTMTIQDTYLELLTEKRGRPRKDAADPKWKSHDAAASVHHADSESGQHIHSSMLAAAEYKPSSGSGDGEEHTGDSHPPTHKFANGEEHAISREHAHAYLKKAAAMKPEDRLAFHQRTNKSHEHFRAGLGLQGAPSPAHKTIVDHMHDATKVKGFARHTVPFGGGMHPHEVDYHHAKKFIDKHSAASPAVKGHMEKMASKSHESFLKTIGH